MAVDKTERLNLRWNYIALPVIIFLLSIPLAVYCYYHLPTEVAISFRSDRPPGMWLSRETAVALFLAPQLFLTLLAIATTWGITRLNFIISRESSLQSKQKRIFALMGNIFVLPQLVLCFAIIYIFSYNSYQIHIMPMWIFLLVILGLATIALGVLLVLILSRAKRQLTS